MQALIAYHWPGNVRELENQIERISILAEKGDIQKCDLPSYLFRTQTACEAIKRSSGSRLEELEKETLVDALSRNNWIQQRAAREIGLTLRQMGYRVKKFGLDELIRREKGRSQSSN
jgi:Nif-specific regulatory protein